MKLADRPYDPDREIAYRRGYVHATRQMMSGVVDKLNDAETKQFELWFSQVLFPWSISDASQEVSPPAFPRLGA